MTRFDPPRNERGNSNDDVRRHNLSVVLGLVHRQRNLSRAQLTRQTGLNRSTVAALVGELVERELVVETEPDATNSRGRPSPIVRPNPLVVAISINPEIDAISIGVVSLGGTVIKKIRYVTEHSPSVGEAVNISAVVIEAMRSELDSRYRTVGIGVAVPGQVRASDGLVRMAPHLAWQDEPFGRLLEDATGFDVVADNDAHLGAMAESTFGAGRGLSDVIYVNGGASGIGGGIIAGGVPLGGVDGYAGEIGHTLVNSDGIACQCGAMGCLETEVRRENLLSVLKLDNADPDELESALLASSSPSVLAEVHRQLDFLAIALRNSINMLNPQLVIVGGFLASIYAAAPHYLEALLAKQPLLASRDGVRVTRAELGSDLLIIGAGELAFEAILADPGAFSFAPVSVPAIVE
ncbi:MAG: ROK family transcriptional regulator [Candidatus Saccharibacteria bacterium]|nr:ROK family transcriptional regulator [Microbacteriaceae bacterium]